MWFNIVVRGNLYKYHGYPLFFRFSKMINNIAKYFNAKHTITLLFQLNF